ncbi:hypothetical protein JHK82_048338 [Glycine max]|nr:hypothetical protein JHK82_048338 [Glycine max]
MSVHVCFSSGDEIHVVCKQDQLKSWKADLKENSTYVMHNFKVLKNDGEFRVCDHRYKLAFTRVTVVRQSDLNSLPFRKFKFADFSNVIASDFQTGLLVDIIGVVDEVVFRHVSSKNTRVVFQIKDLSGQVLSCTLWENYCLQFLNYLNDFEDARPIVILLTHVRIKEGQGSYPPSVSESTRKIIVVPLPKNLTRVHFLGLLSFYSPPALAWFCVTYCFVLCHLLSMLSFGFFANFATLLLAELGLFHSLGLLCCSVWFYISKFAVLEWQMNLEEEAHKLQSSL